MLRDAQGLEVATDSTTAIAAIDRFAEQILGYGTEASAILKGIAADPQCVQANLLAAAMYLFLETKAAACTARPYIEAAATLAGRAGGREQMTLQAVNAWADGRGDLAGPMFEAVVARWPRDLLAAKLAQYHYFNIGDLTGFLRVAELAFEANRENPYAHGMLAFALEQNDRLAEAESAGRQAVAMLRREPWAHHAVAHVMETQGRLAEGIAWLESHADCWEDCNSFMLTHNWWHLALFHLDSDQPERVLGIYDDHVWGAWKDYSQDQVNAVSLLWRLDLRGIDVGGRWHDVADYVARRGPEHVQPFLDLHYVYALARAERDSELAVMMASLENHCRNVQAELPAWAEVALPAARGAVALAQGRPAEAAEAFAPIVPRLQEIGGSHAQRDLFVQSWLAACLASDQAVLILPVLEQRAAARPGVPCHQRQWAEAREMLGLADSATFGKVRGDVAAVGVG